MSLRARSIVMSLSKEVPIKKVLAGWDLLVTKVAVIKTAALPCGVSGEPAGKTLCNVSQVLTCRPEQVLTTSGERQSQRGEPFL